MPIAAFQFHTTMHMAPYILQENETVISQKQRKTILDLWSMDQNCKRPQTTQDTLLGLYAGTGQAAENVQFRVENVMEMDGTWSIYNKQVHTFFVFDPARTSAQRNRNKRTYLVCEDPQYGLSDVTELNGMMLDALRRFMGVQSIPVRPMNPQYYIHRHMQTGIECLTIADNVRAGTWIILMNDRQEQRLENLAYAYCADYKRLVYGETDAYQYMKAEVAGQCVRTQHGILQIALEGVTYRDETNPDCDWQMDLPTERYFDALQEAQKKERDGSAENCCAWYRWLEQLTEPSAS